MNLLIKLFFQAVQIAREMGIHKPVVIAAQVNALTSSTDSTSFKERLARNFERTWLYTFIADKSFGITTGRHMGVSWREIPSSASEWWRKPMTAPTDRILSGIVEMRGILVRSHPFFSWVSLCTDINTAECLGST